MNFEKPNFETEESNNIPETYYEVLGIEPDASQEEIKNSFRKLSKEHHPDAGGNVKQQQVISEAYQTLKNPSSRENYDLRLKQEQIPTPWKNSPDDDFDQEMWEWEQERRNEKKAA